MLDERGAEAVSKWVLNQKKLLITDTTMRDAHQSLLSTRMRTRDMVKGADGTADILFVRVQTAALIFSVSLIHSTGFRACP